MFYQRIYAFLLRRILGPYLTPASCSKLHSCIEVAVSEGRYVLRDVDLRGDKVASLLGLNTDGNGGCSGVSASANLTVQRATVRRLTVLLWLRDTAAAKADTNGVSGSSNGGTTAATSGRAACRRSESAPASMAASSKSSVISRTARLGTIGGGVSLIASVEIEGLEIDLGPVPPSAPASDAPSVSQERPPPRAEATSRATDENKAVASSSEGGSGSGGLLSSYVDAALKSLRLNAALSDLRIRLLSETNNNTSKDANAFQPWVGVRLQSVKYHDLTAFDDGARSNSEGSSTGAAVLRKEIEFNGLVFEVGGNKRAHFDDSGAAANGNENETAAIAKTKERAVARMAGSGDIKILAHAISVPNADTSASAPSRKQQATDGPSHGPSHGPPVRQICDKAETTRLRHDVDFCFGDSRFDVCFDLDTLEYVTVVAKALKEPRLSALDGPTTTDLANEGVSDENDFYIDDASEAKALSDMMRQYAEARHLARTQQIRGGLLLPSSSFDGEDGGGEEGVVTFDTFFDANDQSFCAYRSMMEDSNLSSERAKDTFIHTRVSFAFFATTIKLIWGSKSSEYVELSIGEIKAKSSQSDAESNVSVAVSHLDIEDSFETTYSQERTTVNVGTLLRFVDEGAAIDEADKCEGPDKGCIISSSPCLSLSLVQKHTLGDMPDVSLDVSLHSMEVTYRQSIHKIIESLQSICTKTSRGQVSSSLDGHTNATDEKGQLLSQRRESRETAALSQSQNVVRCAIHLPTITVFIPVCSTADGNTGLTSSLFDRCGYIVSHLSGCETASLGLVFSDVTVDVSSDVVVPERNGTSRAKDSIGVKVACFSCQNTLLFAALPVRERGGRRVRIVDIVALSSESAIDAEAVIKLQYTSRASKAISEQQSMSPTKSLGQKGQFPLVPPLSAVKAQQQFEADEVDDIYKTDASVKQGSISTFTRSSLSKFGNLKSSDPQYAMSSEASACDSSIEVYIPTLVFDLDQKEIVSLMQALNIALDCREGSNEPSKRARSTVERGADENDSVPSDIVRTVISFSCDQVSLAIHGNASEAGRAKSQQGRLAYVFVFDEVKAHLLKNSSGGIRHTRFLLDDLTMYEVSGLSCSVQRERDTIHCHEASTHLSMRCDEVRQRSARSSTTRTRVMCYRSKLSRPLSPETPAFMVDIINRTFSDGDFDDEDDDDEREVYLSVYDMTYRYNPDFDVATFASIFSFCNGTTTHAATSDLTAKQKYQSNEESSSLTNLFVTFSDCVLDYTSPDGFVRSSRCIIRVSEMRASSNLVAPAGPFQALKLSMGDISVNLASTRFPHNAENALLSCASSVLDPRDMGVDIKSGGEFFINSAVPLEATLRRMKFIQIMTLDSVDALVVIANKSVLSMQRRSSSSRRQPKSSPQRPNTTATLSLGQICMYACQDSFVCFTDTIAEWVLHYTTPSADEIKKLKASFDRLDNKSGQPDPGIDKGLLSTDSSSKAIVGANVIGACNEFASVSNKASEESLLSMIDNDMFMKQNGPAARTTRGDLSSSFDELPAPHESSVFPDARESYGIAPNGFEGTPSFTEDEDDWLAVDYEWANDSNIPTGQEQAAKWLVNPSLNNSRSSRSLKTAPTRGQNGNQVRILPQHVPIQSLSDPLSTGDMDAAKFAGTESPPPVDIRVIVKDMSINLRFFAGYDWPEPQKRRGNKLNNIPTTSADDGKESKPPDKKAILLSELLQGEESKTPEGDPQHLTSTYESGSTSTSIPSASSPSFPPPRLPQHKIEPRQTNRFFQVTGHKMKLRLDSFEASKDHRLASCMDMSLHDMFLAETISGDKPVKILGEWFNEAEHPRDTNDGLVMMKMVSMHPVNQISADGKFVSDESRVTMELLPLRFFIYQTALRFVRDFFGASGDQEAQEGDGGASGERATQDDDNGNDEILVSPTFFRSFKVLPCKLKVDYRPERIDTTALRDGSYVELVNLLPLEEMVITLKPVEIRNLTGWGSIAREVARCWIEDICATQMHKFLTKSRPFQPFSSVGAGVAELVMIPLEEYKQDGNVIKGIRESTSNLAGTVAYEALNTSAKVTRFAANRLSGISGKPTDSSATDTRMVVSLPSRPDEVPSNFVDVAGHAFDSLTAGLREANYKIVYIPYKEYQRSGASGAARSVVKGIPVAVRAPLSGASEALSYTLLGVRNQLRPDMIKEEKVTMQGLSRDF